MEDVKRYTGIYVCTCVARARPCGLRMSRDKYVCVCVTP